MLYAFSNTCMYYFYYCCSLFYLTKTFDEPYTTNKNEKRKKNDVELNNKQYKNIKNIRNEPYIKNNTYEKNDLYYKCFQCQVDIKKQHHVIHDKDFCSIHCRRIYIRENNQ